MVRQRHLLFITAINKLLLTPTIVRRPVLLNQAEGDGAFLFIHPGALF